jgi:hypothetical protein
MCAGNDVGINYGEADNEHSNEAYKLARVTFSENQQLASNDLY